MIDNTMSRITVRGNACIYLKDRVDYLEKNFIECLNVAKEIFSNISETTKVVYRLDKRGVLTFTVWHIDRKDQTISDAFVQIQSAGFEIQEQFNKIDIVTNIVRDGAFNVKHVEKIILFNRE